ncbi:hypothetical protein Hanom_Chr02g00099741 [Helianthus anomalus]
MSPRVRTRHGEVTAELAWSGSSSRSEITPAVGGTVPFPPPPPPRKHSTGMTATAVFSPEKLDSCHPTTWNLKFNEVPSFFIFF